MTTSKPEPHFKHDGCGGCFYLGHHEGADLYFCTRGPGPTVIARFSSTGPDYVSGLIEGETNPHLHVAAVRALKAFAAGEIPTKRKVQLYQDLHGDSHTAKFLDEPGKWEASRTGSITALGHLVLSHPEAFNVEIFSTHEWSRR